MTFLIALDRLESRWKDFVRSSSRAGSALVAVLAISLSACSTVPGPGSNGTVSGGQDGKPGSGSSSTKTSKLSLATGAEARSPEPKPGDVKAADNKLPEGKTTDGKTTDGKAVDGKFADGKHPDSKPTEGRLSEGKPAAADSTFSANLGAKEPDYGQDDNQPAIVVAPLKPQIEHDLWVRIRNGFALPALNSPLVAEKEKFYLQKPEYLDRMMTRGGRYLFHIVEEVEKRGLPTELALLPFVESAMNPVAMSSARASGLWQFMPATGKFFNLSQNWWVDDRRDVVHSTRAALDYLQKLHAMHGKDWNLALASYNWGEGAVGRAVRKNRERGRPTDYLSLDMPNETRHYIPKLMAIRNLIANASQRGLALPAMPNKPYFVIIEKTRPIDLKLAAQFAGMSIDEFVALNPAHNRPVIAATKNNEIKLPADRLDGFVAAVTKHDQSKRTFASWQPYTIKDGETLDSVAQRGGVSVADLQKANSLKLNTKILPGTHLLVPNPKPIADERKVEAFVAPRVYEQITNPAVHHTVGKRETIAGIARRYGLNAQTLSSLNRNKTATRGATLLVRPASSHTLLTTEHGQQQVIAAKTTLNRSAGENGDLEQPASNPKKSSVRGDQGRSEKIRSRNEKVSRKSAVGNSGSKKLAKDISTRKSTRG